MYVCMYVCIEGCMGFGLLLPQTNLKIHVKSMAPLFYSSDQTGEQILCTTSAGLDGKTGPEPQKYVK